MFNSILLLCVFCNCTAGEARMHAREPGNPNQEWALEGESIRCRSRPGWCLDIYHARDKNGEKVIPYEYHGGNNQHWHVEYVPL